MAKITLKDLSHSYLSKQSNDADWALRGVNIDWKDGGAYALLGPSGCGKTTLLNIISGLLKPTKGEILFDDKEVAMNIPVKLTGTSPGVLNGGSLRFTNRKLKIKALPAKLPDFVTADISELKIGSKLFVTELFNDDYTFMHPDNTVVVQVRTSRNAVDDEVAEEGAEEGAEAAAEATTEAAAE